MPALPWIVVLLGLALGLPLPNVRFVRPKEAAGLECAPFFEPGFNFTVYGKERVQMSDPKNESDLPTDCPSIRKRAFFQVDDRYPEEREFPIAFARVVFTDYRFLEMDLAATYTPHNFFCYAIDLNASSVFHERMRALADCFPNVLLTAHEFHTDSEGHSMNRAHVACLEQLERPELKWKYVVLLQNHDVPLKTNQELIQIFRWFDGANDIAANFVPWARINKNASWTFEAMHLFRNETRNRLPHNGHEPVLHLAKSFAQVSISRAMVDFMLHELDLTGVIANFDWEKYGIDELLYGSLNSADAVEAPGGFTSYCLDHDAGDDALTRYSIWRGGDDECLTKWRHYNCLFGVEYLGDLATRPHLFANKFMPEWDFGAITCWYAELLRRTHEERGIHRLNASIYLNLPHVRYNREKKRLGARFNLSEFECSPEVKG